MKSKNQANDTCGCCKGIKALTPTALDNLPGLPELAYRVGTHGSFKTTMIAALSGQRTLDELTVRDDDDPSIALIDAWACVLDVLSFYQERIANEGYLLTASERSSVLELARAIGYELKPGVAAGTFLAFTLEDAPGSPGYATIDTGVKVMSIPGQDEKPQTFETTEKIEARAAWNELKLRLTEPKIPEFGSKEVYLKGAATGLKPGDGLLLIGEEREKDTGSERWDFRRVKTVTADLEAGYTHVTWKEGLGWERFNRKILPAKENLQVYAFRLKASLFGHNAPDWRSVPNSVKSGHLLRYPASTDKEWPYFSISSDDTIFLDATYPEIVKGSWVVLSIPSYEEVYKVIGVEEASRTDYMLSAKTTRLKLSGENLKETFDEKLRETVVFAQSEPLEIAEAPRTDILYGNVIELDSLAPGLERGRLLIISGKRKTALVTLKASGLELISADGEKRKPLWPENVLQVLEPPVKSGDKVFWNLMDRDGFTGSVTASDGSIQLEPAAPQNPVISEVAMLDGISPDSTLGTRERTILVLEKEMQNSYDPFTVIIYANVARATHGETVHEVLGSGNGAQANQSFALNKQPVTYLSAPTPSGTESTIEVRVNDVKWQEVPSLYRLDERVKGYITRMDNDGRSTLIFGDGKSGARLTTGQENVSATYRTGIGLEGMVRSGQLSLLMTRPLGVKGVINPLAPTGAEDPEARDKAKQNAPQKVLTLDRIVSLQDFEDFSRAFAGIGKAQTAWLWDGERRFVHVTIASADGGTVDKTSDLYKNLVLGIERSKDPVQQFLIDSFNPLFFNLSANVLVDSRYVKEKVLAAVTDALKKAFSFEQRSFGQEVTESEMLAAMQRVEGVEAVDLDALYMKGEPPGLSTYLTASRAHQDKGSPLPADLLTLNPEGIELKEMIL